MNLVHQELWGFGKPIIELTPHLEGPPDLVQVWMIMSVEIP